MKLLGRSVLALLVAGATGACFRDPLAGLSTRPQSLVADRNAVVISAGSSVTVTATLVDGRGLQAPVANAVWSAQDTAVVQVLPDTTTVPGSYRAAAKIVGRARLGGVTTVSVAAAGLAATVLVGVLPSAFDSSLVLVTGAAHPDTIGLTPFSAPDTLVLRAAGRLQFDTVGWYPSWISTPGNPSSSGTNVLKFTATELKAVFTQPVVGRITVHNVLFSTGDSTLGTIRLDALATDSVAVSRQRFTGDVTVVGDTVVLTAGPGQAFGTPTYFPWVDVKFDTIEAAFLSATWTQRRVMSPLPYTGLVTVTGMIALASPNANVLLGPLLTVAPHTIPAATFPGAIVTGGRLLDTVTVYATPNAKLSGGYGYAATVPATYPCAACRYGVIWISMTPDSVKFIAPVGTKGPIFFGSSLYTSDGVLLAGAQMSVYSRDTLTVSGTSTGEVNEPGNDSAAGATVLTGGPDWTVLGALDGSSDTTDYYTFQVPAQARVSVSPGEFAGSGSGLPGTPEIDVYLCDSLTAARCDALYDTHQASSAVLMPAGPAWLRVALRTPQAGFLAYRFAVHASLTGAARGAGVARRP